MGCRHEEDQGSRPTQISPASGGHGRTRVFEGSAARRSEKWWRPYGGFSSTSQWLSAIHHVELLTIVPLQATNSLESAVTKLLESANLKDNQIAQAEKDALEGQDVSVEEIAARRAELRRQRELLFREESRRKRIAKIKSKTYRKLARKRADKAEGEIDLDDLRALDPQRAEEEQEKMETARARERATLKHSAKGGRWAQGQHGAGEIEGKRQELEHMLAQGERLRRKVQGNASEGSDSEIDSEEDFGGDEDTRARAFDELASLRLKQAELDDAVASSKPSGIFAMKFMQDAARREKVSVDEEERELRRQLESYEDAGIESGGESDESDSGNVARIGGRLMLTGTGLSSQVSHAVCHQSKRKSVLMKGPITAFSTENRG
jgi:U3 small nucleolar RNA-associated protein 14